MSQEAVQLLRVLVLAGSVPCPTPALGLLFGAAGFARQVGGVLQPFVGPALDAVGPLAAGLVGDVSRTLLGFEFACSLSSQRMRITIVLGLDYILLLPVHRSGTENRTILCFFLEPCRVSL